MHLFLHVQRNRLLHSRGTLVLFFNGYSCWITRASCSNHLFLGWTNFNCTNQRRILAAGWFRQTLGKKKKKAFWADAGIIFPPPKSSAGVAGQTKNSVETGNCCEAHSSGKRLMTTIVQEMQKFTSLGNYLRTANWKYGLLQLNKSPTHTTRWFKHRRMPGMNGLCLHRCLQMVQKEREALREVLTTASLHA